MNGNNQTGCNFLDLTGFPKYPYYPQKITIYAYPLNGSAISQILTLKLEDCLHDDLTCEQYYNTGRSSDIGSKNQNLTDIQNIVTEVKIYDNTGRLLRQTRESSNPFDGINYNGMLIAIYFNDKGERAMIQKKIVTSK
jgi:hypothetical protein